MGSQRPQCEEKKGKKRKERKCVEPGRYELAFYLLKKNRLEFHIHNANQLKKLRTSKRFRMHNIGY